jgi:hypothetical protein
MALMAQKPYIFRIGPIRNVFHAHKQVRVVKSWEEMIQVLHSATGSGYLMHASYAPKLLQIYKRDIAEYESTGVFKREYCNDVSWKELQEKDKWYAFRPTIGIQRRSYSDIQKGVVDYGV